MITIPTHNIANETRPAAMATPAATTNMCPDVAGDAGAAPSRTVVALVSVALAETRDSTIELIFAEIDAFCELFTEARDADNVTRDADTALARDSRELDLELKEANTGFAVAVAALTSLVYISISRLPTLLQKS